MDRAEFLKSLGISGAALVAIGCMGCLSACSTDSPAPANYGNVDFTLDLNESANAVLSTDGGFLYKDSVIIAKTTTGSFVALSRYCTHEGVTITFQSAKDRFYCASHGATFSTNGAVTGGPARSNLLQYNTTYDSTTNTLRVYS